MQNFKENIIYLRKQKDLKQSDMLAAIGINKSTWGNYETGLSKPNFLDLLEIAKYFGTTETELIHADLSNGKLIKNNSFEKNQEIRKLNGKGTGKINDDFKEFKLTIAADDRPDYGVNSGLIPITDISVAAGAGVYNNDYIENLETLKLPAALIKKNATYLCVRIKGISMAPTLQDGGYAIIRLLDREEWAKMPDERLYVISDNDGKTALKRVKNRFKQGFIVMRSDSPDTAVYPSYNLTVEEINTIWYLEWYMSAKMPNIHDQYYKRLQRLEDDFADFKQINSKMNPK